MNLYEVAEDAYLARAGTVSTNGIGAAVDAVLAELRAQVEAYAAGPLIRADARGALMRERDEELAASWRDGHATALANLRAEVEALLNGMHADWGNPRYQAVLDLIDGSEDADQQ